MFGTFALTFDNRITHSSSTDLTAEMRGHGVCARSATAPQLRPAFRARSSAVRVRALGFDFGESRDAPPGACARCASRRARPLHAATTRSHTPSASGASPLSPSAPPAPLRGAAPKPGVRAGALQLRAATLLVYQSVLRGAVGEAFLACLAATQKYQARARARAACDLVLATSWAARFCVCGRGGE